MASHGVNGVIKRMLSGISLEPAEPAEPTNIVEYSDNESALNAGLTINRDIYQQADGSLWVPKPLPEVLVIDSDLSSSIERAKWTIDISGDVTLIDASILSSSIRIESYGDMGDPDMIGDQITEYVNGPILELGETYRLEIDILYWDNANDSIILPSFGFVNLSTSSSGQTLIMDNLTCSQASVLQMSSDSAMIYGIEFDHVRLYKTS